MGDGFKGLWPRLPAVQELRQVVEQRIDHRRGQQRQAAATSVWPPTASTAIERRSSAPGPAPINSGSMPATKAIVVIRIGRRRSRLACRMAVRRSMPCGAQLVGVIDLQDRVLLHHAEQHQDAQGRIEVQRLAAQAAG